MLTPLVTYTITIYMIHLLVTYKATPLIKELLKVFLCRKECFASAFRPEP